LASAVGVELFAGVVQHPCGKDCDGEEDGVLGMVPHQIRGFLHNWQVLAMTGSRFKCCVGCSEPVVEGFLKDRVEFVWNAVNESEFLEDVSGITAMKASIVDDACEWEDDDV
jgi:ubiquitin-like modifier-activating enzyme ATG7